jgi:cytochrome d ubiquinol oxidase subunit II
VIGWPEAAALLALAAMALYVLFGGADFGGGVWDLLARGPRAKAQRALIEDVMAPVWEVNHIWLVFVVVLLFSGFPLGFAVIGTALHIPITALLVGIVLRGAAFVFRQYDDRSDFVQRRWGRVFAGASIVAPLFLGVCVGAITSGDIRLDGERVVSGFFAGWLSGFAWATGALVLSLFAFLAAVYLTCEAADPALREDFRRRALVAGVAVGVCALIAALLARTHAGHFGARLIGSWWSLPHQLATGVSAITAFAALGLGRYRLARAAAIAQAALIVLGWGLGQAPYLVAPDLTLRAAAAPTVALRVVLAGVAAGVVFLAPALYALMRTFKMGQGVRRGPPDPH